MFKRTVWALLALLTFGGDAVARLNFADILGEVEVRVNSLRAEGVPRSSLRRFVQHGHNAVYQHLVRNGEDYFIKTATISVVADRQEYGLPSDLMKIRQVLDSNGKPIFPVSMTRKGLTPGGVRYPWGWFWPDSRYDGSTGGQPRYWYPSGKNIGFIPYSQAEVVTLEYVPSAPELAFANLANKAYALDIEPETATTAIGSWNDVELDGLEQSSWHFSFQPETGTTPWPGMAAMFDYDRIFAGSGEAGLRLTTTVPVIAAGQLVARQLALRWVGSSDDTGPSLDFSGTGSTADGITFAFFVHDADTLAWLRNTITGKTTADVAFYTDLTADPTPIRAWARLWGAVGVSNLLFGVKDVWLGWNQIIIPKSSFQGIPPATWNAIRYVELKIGPDTLGAAQGSNVGPFQVDITFDGIGVIDAPDKRTTVPQILHPGFGQDPDVAALPSHPEMDEWIILESVLRWQDIVGTLTEDQGRALSRMTARRDEVRKNILYLMRDRQLQENRQIRRRVW